MVNASRMRLWLTFAGTMHNMIRLLLAVLLALSVHATCGAVPQQPVVCIDPGHPSETSSGAVSGALSENHLNWVVAVRLSEILRADGIRVVLTKSSEHEYVTNRRRAETANVAGALAFIRLHCDFGAGHGFTWYYPSHPGAKGGVTGPPLAVCAESERLAGALNVSMASDLKGQMRSNPVKTDDSTAVGARQGGVLTGSIHSRVPTALIEMCYLNQRSDAAFMSSGSGQEAMATAIARAIERYIGSHGAKT